MKTIPVSKRHEALVDDCDFDRLSRLRWYALETPHTVYGMSSDTNGQTVYMHRLVINAQKGTTVDHVNHDGLDNRRSNLRIATRQEQLRNRRPILPHGFKGVHLMKITSRSRMPADRPWRAHITVDRKTFNLGNFETAEEAAQAYDRKAVDLFGEFACLNFPDS